MKLDEKEIFQTAERIRNGTESIDTLKKVLGGEMLNAFFDETTQKVLFNSIINNGKVHSMLTEGSGIDILEGLLNNRIVGDLSDFYMIKPSYILGLSPEEQRNMAKCISGGREDLFVVLQKLWSKGIKTTACSTKLSDDIPMLRLEIRMDDTSAQELVQQLYQQDDVRCDVWCADLNEFSVYLAGNNLYKYLQEDRIPMASNKKFNIFLAAAEKDIIWFQDMYDEHTRYGVDTTEEEQIIKSLNVFLERFKEKRMSWELSPEDGAKVKAQMTEISSRVDTTIQNGTPEMVKE